MDIVRINDKKLKITLSDADMKRHGVTKESFSGGEQTHAALSRLLSEARGSVGFSPTSRTLVEAFPGRCGGCEIFVVLLEGGRAQREKRTLFYFSEQQTLLCAARTFLSRFEEEVPSALYRLPSGGYVLSLALGEEKESAAPSKYDFLSEYGERRQGGVFLAYIKEYGECVYQEGALSALLA
ncbi:MAG: adaptor protein MecA [Clostridia bacterium]|nr:adaptor protein MecA [Clostridia bacterium]